VRTTGDAAAVRRDDERQPRVLLRPVPGGQNDVGVSAFPVVRAVVDLDDAHHRAGRSGRRRNGADRGGENDRNDDPGPDAPRCAPEGILTTKSTLPLRPERSIVLVERGSRSRTSSVRGGRTLGTSTVTWTDPRCALSEYESGPKLVGRFATEIRLPGR